jgi:hypothetical protein
MSTAAEPAADPSSLRDAIVAKGVTIRELRARGSEADVTAANVVLEELLQLKAQYAALTGEEYRKSTKRKGCGGEGGEGGGSKAVEAGGALPRRAKQPRLPKAKPTEGEKVDPMALPPPPSSFPAWEARDFFRYEVVHTSRKPGSRARVGRITTPHGVIHTPAFVPVGTNAALKCLDEGHSKAAEVQLMFCNTYHLLVHPGPEVVGGGGGLHSWMGHDGPLITDSGGFQVFSLSEPSKDDGPEVRAKPQLS